MVMDSTPKGKTKNSHYLTLIYISLLLLIISALLFLSLLTLFSSNPLFSSLSPPSRCSHLKKIPLVMKGKPRDELEETLRRASMSNKTVIIAVVNKAYVEGKVTPNMLDLFLEGFWAGEGTQELINHLIIAAVDRTAYRRCLFRGLHCYLLPTNGANFTGEQVFMSNDFIDMMWRRTLFLTQVLKKGYSFIFTDTDVLWLRNPFTILTTNQTQDLDIQFSTDFYDGNSSSLNNPINTGFYFVKSNKKTISLFEEWYRSKDNSTGLKEQDVLQNMAWRGVLNHIGLRFQFLQTRHLSGFCQESRDVHAVITVHANCCRFISSKMADLNRVLDHWLQFRANPSNVTTWPKHADCLSSWD